MNRGPIDRARSTLFAAFIGLLVALGGQLVVESIVPVNIYDLLPREWGSSVEVRRIDPDALWVSGTAIRFLSYVLGGLVSVLLLGFLTGRLLVMLIGLAIISTVFEQFPSHGGAFLVAAWSLAAPVGMIVGSWSASARAGVA